MKKRNKGKNAPDSRAKALLRKPWLFAGAAFGLDLAMLITGMALSGVRSGGITYTASGSSIERSDPLAFFGIVAAAVIGVVCVLVALIVAGAFMKRRRAAQILGAAGLLAVSLVMVGGSAYMATGAPVRDRRWYSYSDESNRLIIEETEPYFGRGMVGFYLAGMADEGEAVLLAQTDIQDYSNGEERYNIAWIGDDKIQISFQDGINYRTLTIPVDTSLLGSQGTSE